MAGLWSNFTFSFFEELPDCFLWRLHQFILPQAVDKPSPSPCLHQAMLLLILLTTAILAGMRW